MKNTKHVGGAKKGEAGNLQSQKGKVKDRDVELFFEIGAFRHIDRTWKQFLNPDVANNTEHSFRVAWIALTIARYEGGVDYEKLLMTALVHDLSESRCGDVNYLSRQYVKRMEIEAVDDMFNGSSLQDRMPELMREYEKRESLESRIVKDADNIDVELELRELESKGHSLGTIWRESRQKNVFPKLYTETARKFWNQIRKAEPHDWHLKSPQNRMNGGDWKKKK